jgi:hypothetical protein
MSFLLSYREQLKVLLCTNYVRSLLGKLGKSACCKSPGSPYHFGQADSPPRTVGSQYGQKKHQGVPVSVRRWLALHLSCKPHDGRRSTYWTALSHRFPLSAAQWKALDGCIPTGAPLHSAFQPDLFSHCFLSAPPPTFSFLIGLLFYCLTRCKPSDTENGGLAMRRTALRLIQRCLGSRNGGGHRAESPPRCASRCNRDR